MKEKHIQIIGLLVTLFYGVFVAWVYWAAPKSIEDASIKARETIDRATSKARVMTNTYQVDQEKLAEGLTAFRNENFIVARDLFEKADKEQRDPDTQFYIAYAFYREGWGRFSNDDELFRKGLERVNRVIRLDEDYKSSDPSLSLRNPAELKNELVEGLRITAADFNPLKLTRQRK